MDGSEVATDEQGARERRLEPRFPTSESDGPDETTEESVENRNLEQDGKEPKRPANLLVPPEDKGIPDPAKRLGNPDVRYGLRPLDCRQKNGIVRINAGSNENVVKKREHRHPQGVGDPQRPCLATKKNNQLGGREGVGAPMKDAGNNQKSRHVEQIHESRERSPGMSCNHKNHAGSLHGIEESDPFQWAAADSHIRKKIDCQDDSGREDAGDAMRMTTEPPVPVLDP